MVAKSSGFYKLAWKAIRRDVSFQIDMRKNLTPAQKGLITRYYNEIKSQTGFRPTYRFTSKVPQRLRAVQQYTAQEPGFPKLKAAYVPIPNGSGKPTFRFRKGKKGIQVTVVTNKGGAGEIERVGYLFNQYGDVVTDSEGTIKAILKDDKGESVAFKMMCGQHESSESVSKKFVNETVDRYLRDYDNTDKWFFGIIGYRFDGQATFSEYLKKRKEKPRKPKGKRTTKRKRK